jgi:PAS domain S-box-containing protein
VGIILKVVAIPAGRTPAPVDIAPELLQALDCLRVAVTLFDADERLIYCSRHFNYIFRALPQRESLIGRTYEELIRLEVTLGDVADSARARDIEALVAHRRAQLRAGEYAPRDVELTDGRIVELKARRTPEGGWIVLWSDATQARHLLRRLETAVEMSADAFSFWDSNDRLILCNRLFAELHGFQTPDQIIGKDFRDLVSIAVQRGRFFIDGDADGWIERRLDAHASPAGALTIVTVSGDAYLVRDRATRDGGCATVFTDVTERHRAETALAEQTAAHASTRQALNKSQKETRKQSNYLADLTRRLGAAEAEADTAKTALLRTMSHELKTPLNAILGFSDLLRMSPDRFKPDQIAEYAGLIHQAGSNLFRLINQILDLTKIAAGRYPLSLRALPAGSALWVASDVMSALASDKQITVTIADCESDLMISADENGLATMIGHLVENAVGFTQPGGKVDLSVTRDGGVAVFVIADNGPGVAAENLQRIQEPFEQIGRSTSDHVKGGGLGLPLVRGLAELHGGRFSIESVHGESFTARLELPLA